MKKQMHLVVVAAIVGALASGAINSLFTARADQSERVPPTSGIFTGVAFSGLIGDAIRSISSGNKGATAPANVGGAAVDGLEWIDDSSTPWIKKRYVNGGWAVEGALDPTTNGYIGVIGGGAQASVASASIADLGSVSQANISITGTTTVGSFGSSAPAGIVKIVRFAGALTLTWSSALPVPCGFNLVTAAGDRAIVTHLGSGNWEFTSYQRASGIPIDCSAVGKIEYGDFNSVPALHVAGYGQAIARSSYPAYLAAVTRAQNGTLTSGNATITSVANTKGLGAGMPVEGTGINAGCTIASVTSSTIVLNSSACVTGSGTSTVTVFLTGYGASGSSSTVGVRDCRGRFLAGRDRDDPGSFANRLTPSYFGADSSIFGKPGGAESVTLALANLPTGITSSGVNAITVNPAGSALNIVPYAAGNWANLSATGAGANNVPQSNANGSIFSTNSFTGSNSIAVTSNNTGGSAHANVPPAAVAECVVRVTP